MNYERMSHDIDSETDAGLSANTTVIGTRRWMVTIFNNSYNSADEVVRILMEATACTLEEAAIETWEAHTYGQAPVHFESREVCEKVARVINRIGVVTEVGPEFDD
ncbi:MAG: ATP-dependent Clp protease adaptor ClpS [Chthonomonas sp.]|nr:ATP-dependent Clp protease adaptor ClpS [Chthonomonas sp.]